LVQQQELDKEEKAEQEKADRKTLERKLERQQTRIHFAPQLLPLAQQIALGILQEPIQHSSAAAAAAAVSLLIGGTALAHNLIMVTSNQGEFDCMQGLKVENWRD